MDPLVTSLRASTRRHAGKKADYTGKSPHVHSLRSNAVSRREPLPAVVDMGAGVKDVHKPALMDDIMMGSLAMELDSSGEVMPEEAYLLSGPFTKRIKEVEEVSGLNGWKVLKRQCDRLDTASFKNDTLLRREMWST